MLAPDVFLHAARAPATFPHVKDDEVYAGFNYGYNRTVLANRALRPADVGCFAKSRAAEVQLAGVGRAGVWALLARVLAGDAIAKRGASISAASTSIP